MPSSYPAALDAIPLPDFDAALGQPARTAEALITDIVDSIKALQETLGTSTTPGQLLDVFLPRLDATPAASALTIGSAAVANNIVTVLQDTDDTPAVNVTTSIQRTANTDDGFNNPKALRVKSLINVDTAQNEWAISGEAESHSDGVGNFVSVSGVSEKYGLSQAFGGHFVARDHNTYATPADVTAIVGVEINAQAVGPDHPVAHGHRICLDVISRTNDLVVGGADGEIGTGIRIRTDGTSNGYLRNGLVVDDTVGNPNPITTAILVSTNGAYGLRIQGANTTAAIGLNTGQKIALEGTGAVSISHAASPNRVMLKSGVTDRISFDVDATPVIRINNTQVLAARVTGWAAATGTATRTSFATGSVTLPNLAQAVKALIDDLIAHGLIGA